MENQDIKWMDEHIKDVPNRKKLYKFMCKFLGKKNGLTYKELYMILDILNRKKDKEEESKKHAMIETLAVYKFNNNKLPNDFLENE